MLPWAIGLLAVTAWVTVVQRVLHVRRELRLRERSHSTVAIDSTYVLSISAQMARERRDVLVRMPASLKERLTAEVGGPRTPP